MPGWLGGFGDRPPAHKVVHIEDGLIHWGDGRTLPVEPMIGFVATSPEYETWGNTWAGNYGGNLDVQEVTTGARVILPVNVPGALLHVGDMHARQGDGEICGAGGIEASGTVEISRRADRTGPRTTPGPEIEDATPPDDRRAGATGRGRLPGVALEGMVLWLARSRRHAPG